MPVVHHFSVDVKRTYVNKGITHTHTHTRECVNGVKRGQMCLNTPSKRGRPPNRGRPRLFSSSINAKFNISSLKLLD